jgi:hypothetical protein
MIRQQLQSGLGIFSRKGIDTYRANRKPDGTSEGSIFFALVYLVNPVGSDGLVLNADGVLHQVCFPFLEKVTRLNLRKV